MPLIYVIEDEENIRDLIQVALENSSYRVCGFESAEEALEVMAQQPPDLAIFDVMLPGMDGFSAVRKIRSEPALQKLPVLILTALSTERDTITGLDSGADEYMAKPFGVLELCARVRSLLRRVGMERAEAEPESAVLTIDGLSIYPDTREVTVDGEKIVLTFKEFELLHYLARNRQRVCTREELLNAIWGYDYLNETRTLDIHIRYLRRKLGEKDYISTIRGVGYRLSGEAAQ